MTAFGKLHLRIKNKTKQQAKSIFFYPPPPPPQKKINQFCFLLKLVQSSKGYCQPCNWLDIGKASLYTWPRAHWNNAPKACWTCKVKMRVNEDSPDSVLPSMRTSSIIWNAVRNPSEWFVVAKTAKQTVWKQTGWETYIHTNKTWIVWPLYCMSHDTTTLCHASLNSLLLMTA